jgi:hypothetical protein
MSNTITIPEKIRWEIGAREDDAGDGHVVFYEAFGVEDDGREWTGTAVKCDDELDEITDIEQL